MRKLILLITLLLFIRPVNAMEYQIIHKEEFDNWVIEYEQLEPYIGQYWYLTNVLRLNTTNEAIYCVEPWRQTNNNGNYQTTNNILSIKNWSNDQLMRVQLLMHYGYMYENHQDLKWYLITQKKIWETVFPTTTYFWTNLKTGKKNNNIYRIEEQELEQLVKNHFRKPTLAEEISINYNQEITLIDNNNVLKYYDIAFEGPITAKKEDDKLIIKSTDIGQATIKLSKKGSNKKMQIFYSDTSQDFITKGSVNPINIEINISINGGYLDLTKIAKETEEIKAFPVDFLITKDNYSQKITLNTNNSIIKLEPGHYKIEELDSPKEYLENNTIYEFDIQNNQTTQLTIENQLIEKKVTINKRYGSISENYPENATFAIYNNDKLYKTLKIINGSGQINLPYGKYLIKQIEGKDGYKLVEDFEIIVDNMIPIEYNFIDTFNKTKLQINKYDSKTKNLIKNPATFRIYDINNNKYLEFNDKINFETIEGTLIFPFELSYGKYRLEEISPPIGYKTLKEPIYITVDENQEITIDEEIGNLLKINVYNEPNDEYMTIKVPNTFKNDYYFYPLLAIIIIRCIKKY